jgi:hypothetical protein
VLTARPVDHIPVKDAGRRVGLLRVVLGSVFLVLAVLPAASADAVSRWSQVAEEKGATWLNADGNDDDANNGGDGS